MTKIFRITNGMILKSNFRAKKKMEEPSKKRKRFELILFIKNYKFSSKSLLPTFWLELPIFFL